MAYLRRIVRVANGFEITNSFGNVLTDDARRLHSFIVLAVDCYALKDGHGC